MKKAALTLLGLTALLLAIALAAGCPSRPIVEWVPEGEPQTLVDVERSARATDMSAARNIDVRDAPDRRTQVLVWLRGRGKDGERAASLLTQGFPEKTASVPVRVEVAPVEGVRSLIAVEAFGDTAGTLSHRRVWIFEMDSGRLVRSAAYR